MSSRALVDLKPEAMQSFPPPSFLCSLGFIAHRFRGDSVFKGNRYLAIDNEESGFVRLVSRGFGIFHLYEEDVLCDKGG